MIMLDKENRFNGNTVLAPEYVPSKKDQYEKIKKNKRNKKKKKDRRLKKKFRTLGSILLIFVLGVTIITRYCIIYNMQKELNNIENKVAVLDKDSENLKVELVKYSNLNTIEKQAKDNLHMVVPDKESAIYSDLSYNNFKENTNKNKNDKHKSLFKFYYKLKEMLF